MKIDKNSISELSSAIVDNGRRGEPRAGCDCMQCFGYCIIDTDQAVREQALRNDARRGTISGDGLPVSVDQVLA